MPVFADRVQVSTATTGQGTIALGAALAGYQTFADGGVSNSDVVSYVIQDGDNVEIGTGTYSSTGPTLSRDTVHRSIIAGVVGTTKLTLSGDARVFLTARAADFDAIAALASAALARAGGTMTGDLTVKGVKETPHFSSATSFALNPSANGTRCTLTLVAETTLTDSMVDREGITLRVIDGDLYTLNFVAGTLWVGGPPTLTGNDFLRFEKWGTDLIGFYGLGIA